MYPSSNLNFFFPRLVHSTDGDNEFKHVKRAFVMEKELNDKFIFRADVMMTT